MLVSSVTAAPPFTAAGGQVDVKANLESAVDQPRTIALAYTVTDINGKPLFTSTPVTTALSINSTLTTVDLGTFNTTGLANGQDTIIVTAVDQSSQPLPTATGQGSLLVGLPFRQPSRSANRYCRPVARRLPVRSRSTTTRARCPMR